MAKIRKWLHNKADGVNVLLRVLNLEDNASNAESFDESGDKFDDKKLNGCLLKNLL
jgi:hypothetical protein